MLEAEEGCGGLRKEAVVVGERGAGVPVGRAALLRLCLSADFVLR